MRQAKIELPADSLAAKLDDARRAWNEVGNWSKGALPRELLHTVYYDDLVSNTAGQIFAAHAVSKQWDGWLSGLRSSASCFFARLIHHARPVYEGNSFAQTHSIVHASQLARCANVASCPGSPLHSQLRS